MNIYPLPEYEPEYSASATDTSAAGEPAEGVDGHPVNDLLSEA
ncbi:hypothetical protein HQ32_04475 [Prauserella sp. Am3]|nr:hypothetical protein HQ32_04475 [Prauserella sp. Am3]